MDAMERRRSAREATGRAFSTSVIVVVGLVFRETELWAHLAECNTSSSWY